MKKSYTILSLSGFALAACLGFASNAFADQGLSASCSDTRQESDAMLSPWAMTGAESAVGVESPGKTWQCK